ncbi:MAG TPA: carbohydrate ABC transporter substrate-binding protein [Candidatus Limivivens merdigallinarum]|uniref:Carbohydrate ABC transporter substrate-binding protein n=1 Tax=Candidatus Limivivens merdigallinarum TaxID=2840859 RepID=A0A9D0ZTW5_9FIRM|nr:carbohydrate ABC transporter substrate-binding protein [Candidatus Limivivens merdigallinarum]
MKKMMKTLLTAAIVGTVLTAAGSVAMAEEEPVTVTWFASRPVDGAIDLAIREIAKQYSDEHGGNWQLEVITEADRPSYLQKLQTLVSGGNMPDIIDIDATPYCQELVDAGMLVDVKEYLNEEGLYDSFEPTALAYQEFTNGTMYTLPLEYHVEMIWYNKEIFAENGLEVPTTMDEWLNVCQALSEAGITPIAVDGVDRWPVIRYLAMMPFRETGNEYIISLSEGNASMGDETGRNGIEFFQQIGQYFQEGFAATDYATAQAMFLDGQAAMYYIGDWEIAAMQEGYENGTIGYFYMPAVEGAYTQANEFCVNSGIGMAFNSETFDEKTKDFINYVIENYGKIYAGMDQMTPIKSELPEDHEFSELYLQVREDMSNIGEHFLKPWDCYLDSNTCNVVNDNALLLATGDMDADTFIELVDSALAEYTSGF